MFWEETRDAAIFIRRRVYYGSAQTRVGGSLKWRNVLRFTSLTNSLLRGKRLSIDGHKGNDNKRKKERKVCHGEIIWIGMVLMLLMMFFMLVRRSAVGERTGLKKWNLPCRRVCRSLQHNTTYLEREEFGIGNHVLDNGRNLELERLVIAEKSQNLASKDRHMQNVAIYESCSTLWNVL
jgi:hypothetical protein